jgi:hypothetical protein
VVEDACICRRRGSLNLMILDVYMAIVNERPLEPALYLSFTGFLRPLAPRLLSKAMRDKLRDLPSIDRRELSHLYFSRDLSNSRRPLLRLLGIVLVAISLILIDPIDIVLLVECTLRQHFYALGLPVRSLVEISNCLKGAALAHVEANQTT